MRLRSVVVILALLLLAVFVAINWSAFIAPTTLSLLVASIEAPVGIVMLGILVVCALAFAAYMVFWQSATLLEARRHAKELHEQRVLADQAEASRFTELRGVIHAEIERLAALGAVSQEALRKEIRDNANSLAATIAEIDDRMRRRGADAP